VIEALSLMIPLFVAAVCALGCCSSRFRAHIELPKQRMLRQVEHFEQLYPSVRSAEPREQPPKSSCSDVKPQ